MEEIGIYIPSYNRSKTIITHLLVPSACFVVRKSQERDYREAGVTKIMSVEDDQINSWVNVMNYIVKNAPEKMIVTLDDDIEKFYYISDDAIEISDTETIEMELHRILQIMKDLEIGFGAMMFDYDPKKYDKEFAFAGTLGAVYFFNRDKVIGQFNNEASAVADAEFELQELLVNRIALLPKYIAVRARFNKGIATQNRTSSSVRDASIWTKQKWGKYFYYDPIKNKTQLRITR